MPSYSYTSADGETIERFYRMGEQPDFIRIRRKRYDRNPAADHRSFVDTPSTDGPIESEGLAVHPSQVREACEHAAAKGLTGFQVKPNGVFVFDSLQKKREYQLAYGWHDKNAGYSDISPEDVRRYRESRGEPQGN